jgi:acetyl esterase/lipase
MPIGYLFTVALIAVATGAALVPPRRPPVLAAAGYHAGMTLNELPFLAAAYLLAATALAAAQGDFGTPGGLAGLAVAAATVAGLATVVRRGLRARPVVERAMTEALGDGWRTVLRPRRLPWARILLLPFVRRRHDVVRSANLSYGDAGRRNRLDVYHHRGRPLGGPVLIHLHGGRYTGGRKNSQSLPLLYRLASQGWVCNSATYRLRPAAGLRDHLADAGTVIAWARAHAAGYGADPAVLFLAGSSAGAHLAALTALRADTTVTGVVCLNGYYGSYYDEPAGGGSSPYDHVRPDAPPFLLAHGDRDTVVPVEQARGFADRLRRVSANPVVYAELPGGQHAFDLFHSVRFEAVVDAVEAFAAWTRTSRSVLIRVPADGGRLRGQPGSRPAVGSW